jgi:non-specific serine/threonine protein kinase
MLEVRLLGKFEVRRDGRTIAITSRPAQSLFAYLILHAGTAHRREKLAGMLWPDSLEETARDNLRHALWRVRKALEAGASTRFLKADDLSIGFQATADYWLDAAALEKTDETTAVDQLIAALSEYHGELLPGFYDEWVMLEREHLYSIFEHQMARLMSLLQEEKRWLDVLEWGERWIKLGQKPEPAYRALMSAHAAKGDMSRVAAIYERCVKSLKEFGIEPSEQTRALYERLRSGKETFEARSATVVTEKRKEAPKTNLPVPLTSFVGREKEISEVVDLLKEKRLLTLTGSGGVGKTRLAIEASNRLVNEFEAGISWVDLVGLSDASLVPQAVARVADVREIPNQPVVEVLIDAFQAKQILFVLDNCEHLISACAELADRLLSGCQHLKILATSREPLDILGETIWPVPSLSLPDRQESLAAKTLHQFESIRLFVDRATSVQPKFSLGDQNASAVVQICNRLSGMPLAIELAAARVKMISVDEIARRLDDRFSLLTSGNRTALPRHQTLRATIDWSYDLLTEPEQILFRRLAVFAGGFKLEAAEVIAGRGELEHGEIFELLGRLVDKSLVIAEQSVLTEGTRFRLLETIRQYAHEKLEEKEGTRIRDVHLEFFTDFVEEAEPHLELAEQGVWLDRLELEMDNIRAAIDWALASAQVTPALRLVAGLRRFWLIRNHDYEGFERMTAILGRLDALQPTSARLKALNAYFFMLWPHGRLIEAQALIDEALRLGTTLNDDWNTAFSLLWAGVSATEQADYSRAQSYLEQSIERWRKIGAKSYEAITLNFLGELGMFQNDFVKAESLFRSAAPQLREAKDHVFLAWTYRRLGQLGLKKQDLKQAEDFVRESLVHNWQIHDLRGTGASLAALAAVNIAQRKTARAVTLLAVVEAIIESTQIPPLLFDQQEYERNVSHMRSQLNSHAFGKAWSQGKRMVLEQAVDFALNDSSSRSKPVMTAPRKSSGQEAMKKHTKKHA